MYNKSSIAQWLHATTSQLNEADIPSARLDAELILAHTLRKSRTYLHAHSDESIPLHLHEIADARIQMRLDRTPLAYIIGHKEFYGRRFRVTPATLIPRPESEAMITLLKKFTQQHKLPLESDTPKLVDVGTGTGCLGITAKLELRDLDVTLTDSSRHALTVAEANAKRLDADVQTLRSDLLVNYPFQASYILANLPYVDESWEVSPETKHEPREALFAPAGGLGLINRLIEEAPGRMSPGGLLLLEADPRQHSSIVRTAGANGFRHLETEGFIQSFQIR